MFEGNGGDITRSDPSLMINLFLEYPDINFDIFHIGYPYQAVLSALGKMYPNVFIDMCWAHIISPSASINALDDFLDAIPYNKISAFGGDYCFVDGIYGHLMISRQNVSRTLEAKIKRGVFNVDKALEIAKALYYDNPKRILQL
jgi:predicted TIM-barrel fold metal-dependent hydrolase